MKLLLYSTAFAPSVGGVETYVTLLAKGLASYEGSGQPIEVTVATATLAGGYDDGALPFRVVRQPSLALLSRLLRHADVVQFAGPVLAPLAIAWMLRKRVIVEHHGYQAKCPNGLFLREPMNEVCPGYFEQRSYGKCLSCAAHQYGRAGAFRKVFATFPRRWLTRRVAQNVCVSEHVERRLDLPRSRVIYHGIPAIAPSSGPKGPSEFTPIVFGYIGRLVGEKDLGTLVEAARLLANEGLEFQLRLVGDGPERGRLEAAVTSAGLANRTRFTGFLKGEALTAAVGEVSVMVMPSIWEETFGLSALEQMQRGSAVIAADIGGLAEVVDGGGLKFAPGNAASLAAKMREFVVRPNLIGEIGQKARERATFFPLSKMIESHAALYRKLTQA